MVNVILSMPFNTEDTLFLILKNKESSTFTYLLHPKHFPTNNMSYIQVLKILISVERTCGHSLYYYTLMLLATYYT
jgi:hypothetical protein